MEAFQEMPKAARNEVFTSFLMFKVAVRTSDKDLGMWSWGTSGLIDSNL
jgi:hypothetical protein